MQSVSGTFSLLSVDLQQIASAQPSLLGIFDIYNQQSLPDLQIIQANIVGLSRTRETDIILLHSSLSVIECLH